MATNNTSTNLMDLDIDTYKNSLKEYLKSQDRFKDYDFEGSNISVLLDVLAYNTFNMSFYLNMIGSEMFLDSAQMRDSVISHAKELNYLPSSFKSASAKIDIIINTSNTTLSSIVIPKGFTFIGKASTGNLTFSTNESVILYNDGVGNFKYSGLDIYEGEYVADQFVYQDTSNQKFILSNENIDLSSINVVVIEDSGSSITNFSYAPSLFDLNERSAVFFLQPSFDNKYEILFGDNVVSRKPKNNASIMVEYRLSSGEIGNGLYLFEPNTNIAGFSDINITTISSSSGGTISETTDEIRFNAPRHFSTQERAVTVDDYETLLSQNFPEINAISAYGGEENDPPQYGKVFISVDLKDMDGVSNSKSETYKQFIKQRNPLGIEPIIVQPEFLYISLESNVKYNINQTSLSPNDIYSYVMASILNYNNTYANKFKSQIYYSKLVKSIDDSHYSIVGNTTSLKIMKKIIPSFNTNQSFVINFNYSLSQTSDAISSSTFKTNNQLCSFGDDGNGNLLLVSSTSKEILKTIGNIDYVTGKIIVKNLNVAYAQNNTIKIYAKPVSSDINSGKNIILSINIEDINLSVTPIQA